MDCSSLASAPKSPAPREPHTNYILTGFLLRSGRTRDRERLRLGVTLVPEHRCCGDRHGRRRRILGSEQLDADVVVPLLQGNGIRDDHRLRASARTDAADTRVDGQRPSLIRRVHVDVEVVTRLPDGNVVDRDPARDEHRLLRDGAVASIHAGRRRRRHRPAGGTRLEVEIEPGLALSRDLD